ncbi:MAG: hypothetical protein D6732_13560 [Methanobacteriota archaeon]|nr:MAG: hypothetical protein D6732_13560 [Euryarchaeota archaeon]
MVVELDIEPLSDYHIKTTWEDGLQDEHVEKAINLLKNHPVLDLDNFASLLPDGQSRFGA